MSIRTGKTKKELYQWKYANISDKCTNLLKSCQAYLMSTRLTMKKCKPKGRNLSLCRSVACRTCSSPIRNRPSLNQNWSSIQTFPMLTEIPKTKKQNPTFCLCAKKFPTCIRPCSETTKSSLHKYK